jgi:Fuc2NAc and GlcNAc transferase
MYLVSIAAFVLLTSALGAALIAGIGRSIGLVDVPNERSSHSALTPRGGGIGFWIAFMSAGTLFMREYAFVALSCILGLFVLLSDAREFSARPRLLIHLVFAAASVAVLRGVPESALSIAHLVFWMVFIAGTANFFNFMDGIDGIAGLTGLVGFGLLAFFSRYLVGDEQVAMMSLVLAVGCAGFLPFNFPRARVFMGDVGSIFLGFVFASFVMRISTDLRIFLCASAFLSTFYADTLLTIYCRWKKGEDLMKAHRSHLYQFMSNELSMAHWKVSLIYAGIQLLIGALAITAYPGYMVWQVLLVVVFGLLWILSYKTIKAWRAQSA